MTLARHWGEDADKAARAGLLHDCAKELGLAEMRRLVLAAGEAVDSAMWDSPALLHAPASAYLAKRDYGIDDAAALDAIRWHTTGRAGMGRMEMIVYLADMLEPGRPAFAQREEIRAQASKDLHEAMRLALRSTVAFILRKGRPVHIATQQALQWLEQETGGTAQDKEP